MLPRTDAGRVHPRARSARVTPSIGPIAAAGNASVSIAPRIGAAAEAPSPAPCGALLAGASARLDEARALGNEAARAASDARSASDVEGVLLATRKADAAFRMLEAARNAMLEAYGRMGDLG